MPAREELKSLLAKENMQMKALAQKMTETKGKGYTLQSISVKLSRGTFSFNDMETAAEILGYEIKFEKIKEGWFYHEPKS